MVGMAHDFGCYGNHFGGICVSYHNRYIIKLAGTGRMQCVYPYMIHHWKADVFGIVMVLRNFDILYKK